ncbi:putative ribonuclease H-like domain-containing protein [Tanacetum coccineum]
MMHKRFQMSYMRELIFFLGLQVQQKEDGIFISQDKYVADILKKFDFTTVKAASTPIKTNKALNKDEEAEDVDVHLYRSMIGSLMYLTISRPNIMFAVCACARFQVTLKVSHLHAVKRIFRYLKGQPKLGLWYHRDSPFDLEAFSDSDYAGASLDRKSTTGEFKNLESKRTTKISQSSRPIHLIANETVYKEWEDRMKKAATTASSLEAEQLHLGYENEFTVHNRYGKVKVVSEASIRRHIKLEDSDGISTLPTLEIFEQLALMGLDTPIVFKQSHCRGQILLGEVKKLEHKVKSSKSRRKVRLVVSEDEDELEDPSKQGRKIAQIDEDEGITLVQMSAQTQGRHEHDLESDFEFTTPEEDYTAKPNISTANVPVSTAGAEVSTASPEVKTAAESLVYIRRSATKRKESLKKLALFIAEEWDNIQAQIEADEELAHRLQAQEREKHSEADKDYTCNIIYQAYGKSHSTTIEETFFDEVKELFENHNEEIQLNRPMKDKKRELWVELKRLFGPDDDDILWKLQRGGHTFFMLVEKDYPLTRALMTLMLSNKLQVDECSVMADELLRKIFTLQTDQDSKVFGSILSAQMAITAPRLAEIFAVEICRLYGMPKAIVSDRDSLFMKYWYNSSYHSSICMTPFEALYGCPPPTIVPYIAGETPIASLDEHLQHRQMLLTANRSTLSSDLTDKCQSNVDTLKSSPSAIMGHFRSCDALVELDLPPQAKIHNVFHVSLLRGFIGDPLIQTSTFPPHNWFSHQEIRPLQILGQRKLSSGLEEVLVHWDSTPTSEVTWETKVSFVFSEVLPLHLQTMSAKEVRLEELFTTFLWKKTNKKALPASDKRDEKRLKEVKLKKQTKPKDTLMKSFPELDLGDKVTFE